MKYVIIIPDGCADDQLDVLQGRTPLQAAHLPNMDAIAKRGVVGRANNVPQPLTPASDVATLSLFGYDPLAVYTGRAPLETVAMGIPLGPRDWAIRCNLVHIKDNRMHDFTAGHIHSADGARIMATIQQSLGGPTPQGLLEFHAGVQYRNILVVRDPGEQSPFDATTKTQPPHDIPDQPIAGHLPTGTGSELLRDLMARSVSICADHLANRERIARGDKPATQIWLWGQGRAPSVVPFAQLHGKRGAIISAVDLVRGTGMLIGWQRIDAPGATGYLDTDYASKGRTAIAALRDFDVVCVHIEAPDEASHEGRADAKVDALENIDKLIVGPVLEELQKSDSWRILVSPDHRTTIKSRAHSYGKVPFAVAGTGIQSHGQLSYDEFVAEKSHLDFDQGWRLMKWFIG